ncbi:MAG TPA: cytochrome C oxidase subunit IV family protein [Acidimicrobiia bacterium]
MSDEHATHPAPAMYWKIAVVLAGLTAIEVAMYYIDRELGLGFANAAILIALAVAKFIIVVGWYMHLRYEKPMLNRFFTAGFVLALSLYTIVLTALGVIFVQAV